MRISCPSCAAIYDVPDALLAGPARTLRCSRCGADFSLQGAAAQAVAAPVEPVIDAPPPPPTPPAVEPVRQAEARPEPVADEVRPAAPPLARDPITPGQALVPVEPVERGLGLAWAASLALVAGAVIAMLAYRQSVMEAWPPATRLFAALGLA